MEKATKSAFEINHCIAKTVAKGPRGFVELTFQEKYAFYSYSISTFEKF
jgi:hypothetical protein